MYWDLINQTLESWFDISYGKYSNPQKNRSTYINVPFIMFYQMPNLYFWGSLYPMIHPQIIYIYIYLSIPSRKKILVRYALNILFIFNG
jgi:hypothetical protein